MISVLKVRLRCHLPYNLQTWGPPGKFLVLVLKPCDCFVRMPAASMQSNFGQNAMTSFSPRFLTSPFSFEVNRLNSSDAFGSGPAQSLLDMPSGKNDFGANPFSDNQNPFASNQNDASGLFGNSMPAASNFGLNCISLFFLIYNLRLCRYDGEQHGYGFKCDLL